VFKLRFFMKKLFLVMVAAVFFLFFIGDKNVFAQVIINEIMWMGTEASVNDEWIELFNSTVNEIDLLGWTLIADDGTPKINLQGQIAPWGFFLLERGDDQTVSNVVADQLYSGALGNDGEYLFLKNNLGQIIDEVDASLGWPAGSNEPIKASMARGMDGSWLTGATGISEAKDASGNTINGTPKETNNFFIFSTPTPILLPTPSSTISPTPSPFLTPTVSLTPEPTSSPTSVSPPQNYDNIFLNEVMANPGEGPEWVELYNVNNFIVDLENWFLDDLADGGSAPQKLSLTIEPYGYGLVNLGKNIFNNTGDEVYLLNSSGQEKDHFSYSKTVVGQSWGKNEDRAWCLQEPSPGEVNRGCFIKSPTGTTTPTPIAKAAPTENQNPEMISILGQSDQPETGRITSPTLKTYLMAEDNPRPKLRKESSSLPGKNWLPDWLLLSGGVLNFGVGLTRVLRKITP
jgi:hypothetical protein